jgi:hypothetical protein
LLREASELIGIVLNYPDESIKLPWYIKDGGSDWHDLSVISALWFNLSQQFAKA